MAMGELGALSLIVLVVAAWLAGTAPIQEDKVPTTYGNEVIKLPPPSHDSDVSVEKALLGRRSVREFKDGPLTLREVSQLLWAAQGITAPGGLRTAPSAGALYPLEVYVAVGNVEGLPPGVYRYRPDGHELKKITGGDKRAALCDAALGQTSIKNAPASIVIAGVYERTTGKYGMRTRDELAGASYPAGVKYVHMEAGHAAQNVYLQAAALRLGTVAMGAFNDDEVKKVLGMGDAGRPLYVMPVGRI